MDVGNKSMKNRYSLLQISLHWLTLLMIVLAYGAMLGRDYFPDDYRVLVRQLHYNFGLSVWVLVFIRILLRHRFRTPPITPPLPRWQAHVATLTHWLLYLLFLALPTLGFLTVQFAGRSIYLLGWELPQLVPAHPEWRSGLRNTHELVANIGYYLVALHALAALFHHYFMKDDTLKRMLP
jgi:cytochrome b561